jgi:hypothetical protein
MDTPNGRCYDNISGAGYSVRESDMSRRDFELS